MLLFGDDTDLGCSACDMDLAEVKLRPLYAVDTLESRGRTGCKHSTLLVRGEEFKIVEELDRMSAVHVLPSSTWW